MTRSNLLAMLAVAGAIIVPPASAQDRRPDPAAEDSQRYEFTAMSRYGFMRLDRQTGEVSHCRSRRQGWSCEPIADSRAAYQAEITQQKAEIAQQKARIVELEAELARQGTKIADLEAEVARRATAPVPAPTPAPAPQIAPRPEVKLQLPSDEEVDRALRYLESVFRRFIGMVDRLRTEKDSGRT
jgi:hypothetical protein